MAEGFLKAALAKDPGLSSKFNTSSAGISSYEGDRASSNSIDVMMSEWKIDISNHTASPLNKKETDKAFLILTMTKHQKESVITAYPDARGKTYTLKEFTCNGQICTNSIQHDNSLDISDPYGKPLHIYSCCAREIKKAVDIVLTLINQYYKI